MSLIFVAKIYFNLILLFLGLVYSAIEFGIWPQLIPFVPSPLFLLNGFLVATISLAAKETLFLTLLYAGIASANSSFGIGYFWLPYLALWLIIDVIKKHTFLIAEQKFFRLSLFSYFIFMIIINLTYWAFFKKTTQVDYFSVVIASLISAALIPLHYKLFTKILEQWKKTKWGEVIHE